MGGATFTRWTLHCKSSAMTENRYNPDLQRVYRLSGGPETPVLDHPDPRAWIRRIQRGGWRTFSLVAAALIAGCAGRGATANRPPAPAVAPEPAPHAGLAPLRRLTREQYANTIRDLLGTTDKVVVTDLPVDEGAGGFYSNVIAPVSELHLEKYRNAAEALAGRAAANLPAILPCLPDSERDRSCGAQFIERFGLRAFRRPLAPAEGVRYQKLFESGLAQGGFAAGVRLVVQTMLQSVNFLYRFEPAPVRKGALAAGDATVVPLPPFAIASRLSYFLWNTMPDDVLLAEAAAGRLATREQVAGQATRMTRDERFRDATTSFHLQWLGVVELEGKEKRRRIYPLWTDDLRAAMREETVRFVDHVLREGDGRLETLLTARFSILNGPLFGLYGLGTPPGGRDAKYWQKVALDPAQRAGILTHASVLAIHAHWDKSSLVHRGKLIREKLLCTELPPPPPEVNNTLPPADPKVSARERFEEHRSDVGCSKCHKLIDPLGSPFETYDGIGNWRTKDGPRPVDSEGELTGTAKQDGPVKNAIELVGKLAASDEVRLCVAKQWLRYALGREDGDDDAASLEVAMRAFRGSDYRIPALIAAITTTDAFRYQQVIP